MQDSYRLEVGYFAGKRGDLQASIFYPKNQPVSGCVLHVPAFAEEMNKSRAMVAAVSRDLARSGTIAVVVDLFGTGDSQGGFKEADWAIWTEDLLSIACWIRSHFPERLTLLGHRLGCLLAAEVAAKMKSPPDQLVLWQPVHSGKSQMTQFLRVRVAAAVTNSNAATETVAQLRQALSDGSSIEAAGYQLTGELYSQVESRSLGKIALPHSVRVAVFEVADESVGVSGTPMTAQLISKWIEQGRECSHTVVVGDRFWATQERSMVPPLIDATVATIVGESNSSRSGLANFSPGSDFDNFSGASQGAEAGFSFASGGATLAAILHGSKLPADSAVLIVVGGPQYRVGSHRQFVLLARALAAAGIPCMRFDYQGMGDSDGNYVGFSGIGQDIGSAIDALQEKMPRVKKVILWGLCDAASAAVFYASKDERVKALVLANPWVFSEQGAAKAYLKHYYLSRFMSKAFWSKLLSGSFDARESLASGLALVKKALSVQQSNPEAVAHSSAVSGQPVDLVTEFALSLARFSGDTLLLLSSSDLTAAEFLDASKTDSGLNRAINGPRIQRESLAGIDHTFSRAEWREKVENMTIEFVTKRC